MPATDVDIAEKALGRGAGCSQFMRHRAEFFFPDKLEKLGIPYRLVDQRPGETIVVLPDAYHEGFSTGYTLAEAKNYADTRWSTESYQPCRAECKLATAIPATFMQPVQDGEKRLDLCAPYSEGSKMCLPQMLLKREHSETVVPSKSMTEGPPPLENRPFNGSRSRFAGRIRHRCGMRMPNRGRTVLVFSRNFTRMFSMYDMILGWLEPQKQLMRISMDMGMGQRKLFLCA